MDFPFEFCALQFLLQWQRSERGHYRQIRNTPTVTGLRGALSYFQVARNFPGLSEEKKAQSVLSALISVRSRQNLSPEEKVATLANEFLSEFHRFNLSAASKLLWLSSRHPFVILDSRAIYALKARFKHRFDSRNYSKYCSAWRTEYDQHERKILAAVKALPRALTFMPDSRLSEKHLLDLATTHWFRERVFDTYLWEIGGTQ
jgi:hypothetical protein